MESMDKKEQIIELIKEDSWHNIPVKNTVNKIFSIFSQRSELLLKQQSDWLMKSTTLSVEAIVEFQEKFKQ